MHTIKSENELKDEFALIIALGKEVIPEKLFATWGSFINKYEELEFTQAKEYLEQCDIIVKFLLKFKNYRSGKEIAKEYYSFSAHKSDYYINILNNIATFAPFPENVKFLQGYYELFVDITKSEESALTERITNIRNINDMMNVGLSYEEALDLNRCPLMALKINDSQIPLIYWINDIYYGVNESDELTIYTDINKEYDVIYTIKDGTYTRMLNRQEKFLSNAIISSKSIISDEENKVLSIGNDDISLAPNFYDIPKKVAYYQKSSSELDNLDETLLDKIIKDSTNLKDTCASDFKKMLEQAKYDNNQTK